MRLTDGHDPEVQRLTNGEGGLAQVAIVKAHWKAEDAIDDGGAYLLAVERLPRKVNGVGWIELTMDGPRGSLGWGEAGEQAEAEVGVAMAAVGTWVEALDEGEATLVLNARRDVPMPDQWRAWLIQLDQRDHADDLVAVQEVDLTT